MVDTAKEGWGKFFLHFGAWLGIPSVALYLASKAGVSPIETALLWVVFFSGVTVFVVREIKSTKRGVQTKGKMAVDLTAKSLGLFVALFTAKWWWKKKD